MDDLRYRSQQARNDLPISSLVSPPRNGTSRIVQQQPAHDHRANLPRRFTTDSGRVPTLSSMTSSSKAPELSHDYSNVNVSISTCSFPRHSLPRSLPRPGGPLETTTALRTLHTDTLDSRRCTKFNWYVTVSDTLSLKRWRPEPFGGAGHLPSLCSAPAAYSCAFLSRHCYTNTHYRLNRRKWNMREFESSDVVLSWRCKSSTNSSVVRLRNSPRWRKKLFVSAATSPNQPPLPNIVTTILASLPCSLARTAIPPRASPHPLASLIAPVGLAPRSLPRHPASYRDVMHTTTSRCHPDLCPPLAETAMTKRKMPFDRILPAIDLAMRTSPRLLLSNPGHATLIPLHLYTSAWLAIPAKLCKMMDAGLSSGLFDVPIFGLITSHDRFICVLTLAIG